MNSRGIFHTGRPVPLRVAPALRKMIRKRAVVRKLGGRCARCPVTRPELLEVHHVHGNGAEHRAALLLAGTSLAEWVLSEAAPGAGRFAVTLLCLNCHRLAHL
jgi:hypothetical protein